MASHTVNTVTGAIDVDQLGVTLMHEHLLIGYPGWEAHTPERISTTILSSSEVSESIR